jgi:hypothetical protein
MLNAFIKKWYTLTVQDEINKSCLTRLFYEESDHFKKLNVNTPNSIRSLFYECTGLFKKFRPTFTNVDIFFLIKKISIKSFLKLKFYFIFKIKDKLKNVADEYHLKVVRCGEQNLLKRNFLEKLNRKSQKPRRDLKTKHYEIRQDSPLVTSIAKTQRGYQSL